MASLDDYEKLGGDILAGKTPPKKRTKWDDMEDAGGTILEASPPPVVPRVMPPVVPSAAPSPTAGAFPTASPPRWTEDNPLFAMGDPREALPPSTVDWGKVGGAIREGWNSPVSLLPPGSDDAGQERLWGPYLGGAINTIFRAPLGIPTALTYGAAEFANQVTGDPRAGRDVKAIADVLPMALHGFAGPRALQIDPTPLPGRPRYVSERFAPDVSQLDPYHAISALIRHDDLENPLAAPDRGAPNQPPAGGSALGGPRATLPGGEPIPTGLTPEQVRELQNVPKDPPPMKSEIITQADADARADEIIRHFGSMGNTEPIPGAVGGLPTITGNGGLATLYRAVRDKEPVNPFLNQETALKKATGDQLKTMSGTEPEYNAAIKNRSDITDPMYKQAWANKTEADPSGPIKTVEDLMQSPLKQNDTAMAELKKIHKKLQGETDPEQLKGITDAIDATVQELNTAGKADRRTRAALAAVDEAITGEISRTTPGFDAAQAKWAELSKRIDEMKYLQGRKLTDLQGQPTLGTLRATLDDIRTKQAGDKFHPADGVTPENIETLRKLHDQAQREAFTASAGKSLGGSNTFQNFATDSVLSRVAKQAGANVLGTGVGYLADLTAGGGGVAGAVTGNMLGNVVQGVRTVRETQAVARREAGQAMLMQALRERLMNIDNKGVEALRRAP